MRVGLDSVVFAYSGDVFSSSGNTYIRDFGPNGFHMRFGAAGAAPVPQLDGSLLFSGAQYAYFDGDLARYYAKMPVGECTWLFYGGYTGSVSSYWCFYSCWNSGAGGVNKGSMLGVTGTTNSQIIELYHLQGAGLAYTRGNVSNPLRSYGGVAVCTVEAASRVVVNQKASVGAWVGAFGTAVYDPAIVPRIGMTTAGTFQWTGRGSHLCLLRGAVSSSDMAELSAMMMNGRKPFCVR